MHACVCVRACMQVREKEGDAAADQLLAEHLVMKKSLSDLDSMKVRGWGRAPPPQPFSPTHTHSQMPPPPLILT
jgi:hypothetical protein